jgi:molybdopterin-guanine dinucleotide biosynthesis protein A
MGASREITGFVLAGGRSSRLGRDKALLAWPLDALAEGNSRTLLQHSIARLHSVCSTVSVCADRNDLPFAGVILPDARPESGPLGGIVAGLEYSSTNWNLMLAVDLPFLPVEVLQGLVAHSVPAEKSSGPAPSQTVACVLPQVDGLPQPLCGLYHRALAPGLRRALESGKLKVMAALQEACEIAQASRRSDGPEFRIEMWDVAAFAATRPAAPNASEWFLNINTPEDWEGARQSRSR